MSAVTGHGLLTRRLADELARLVDGAEPGHCVRIDDVDRSLAPHLASALSEALSEVAVHILREAPGAEFDIAAERAIEIRNRKLVICLLLVPAGEGHAASSLDNSFQRVPILDVYARVETDLINEISDRSLRDLVVRNRRSLRAQHKEAWAEFLAHLCVDPSEKTFGRNLWRVGLVPDMGENPGERIHLNRVAVRAISQPFRAAAALDERFTNAGIQEGSWRGVLRRFCEQRGSQLANSRIWAKDIGDNYPDLSFDQWPMAEAEHDDIDSLEVVPFIASTGKLETWSKLKQGADNQLVLEIPENGTAPVTVRWKTTPLNVTGIVKWELAVVPPDDLRSQEQQPLAVVTIDGGKRQGTVKVVLEEDSLEDGTRFVVRVRAIGEHGESITLTTGSAAEADSQEFQIVGGSNPDPKTRRTAAVCVPEAVVRAALEGMDDLTEDLVSWDLPGQVFSLRLGNRRAIQVRICELLIKLQRRATQRTEGPVHFIAEGSYGTPLDLADVRTQPLNLPNALRKARDVFLEELSSSPHRDTVESAEWGEPLRTAATDYAASYKRALEQGGVSQDVLLMDTLTLSVRRNNDIIRAVVVLPTHPIRALWVSSHDQILRDWAHQLTDVTPRGARGRSVDADLLAQVVPANLPFAVPTAEGSVAIYNEELTFGAGMFIVPSTVDSEAAAESVASVLDLPRAGSTRKASSQMVAERIRAYEAAHGPGGTLRALAVNPGSGELVAGALRDVLSPGDDDESDPRRLEVMAYSDSPSYTRPVPALAALQATVRSREFARKSSHLSPPLALGVRPVGALKTDDEPAHLAIVQDVGAPRLWHGQDPQRRASFNDLLVPLVTKSFSEAGELVWESVVATGPLSGGTESDISVVHRAHQRAVARGAGWPETSVPAVRVVLDGEHQARIVAAHTRADWVIGVDRFVGVDLFESGGVNGMGESFILDYAPDFVEGIGERLTVTTSNHREVELLLEDAMSELGLADVQHSVGDVLSTLSVVSGRLALRLLENSNHAREAVSLAAVVTHLRQRGDLEGLIVVPVDAHPEIFGVAARDEGAARRCDLLLVRVGQRSFKIECVEVKSRKDARLPQMLADHICDQLQDTKRVLESRFFATDPPRIDGQLQLARLASVLHYYADRSAVNRLIDSEKIGDVHRYIDRVTENQERAEISMRGYVVSLDGAEGFKKNYGEIPMTVLTADDLGQLGFTTVLRPSIPSDASEDDEPSDVPAGRSLLRPTSGPTDESATRAEDHSAESRPSASAAEADDGAGRNQRRSKTGEASDPSDVVETPNVAEDVDLDPSVSKPGGEESEAEPASEAVELERPHELEVVLGLDTSSAEVTWRVSTQGSPHAFVIGIPGQGKSVTTRRIISSFADQRLPSLVFDFHGDMAADPPAGATVLNAAEGLPFSPFEADVRMGRPINTTAWEISEVVAYVTKLGEIQRNTVYDALLAMYAEHGWHDTTVGDSLPTIGEFSSALETAESSARGKNARQRLRPMTDFGLFRDDASGSFDLLEAYGGGVVVDVSQIGLEEVQMFAASFILRKIYREMFKWDQDHTLKLAVVLDEAHRMAKDVTLPKLMKEGRKYGVSVIVASQNADDFHKDVLGNAGTKIVFRTNHPASRAVAGYLRGRGGSDLSVEVEKLSVGCAYVSTPDNPQARKTYMSE